MYVSVFYQGFLCPQCMKNLSSADALQKHFETAHNVQQSNDSEVWLYIYVSSYCFFSLAICLSGCLFMEIHEDIYKSLQVRERTQKCVLSLTVKPVLNGHSKIDKTKILMTNGSLMKVESIAECSHWSILQYL